MPVPSAGPCEVADAVASPTASHRRPGGFRSARSATASSAGVSGGSATSGAVLSLTVTRGRSGGFSTASTRRRPKRRRRGRWSRGSSAIDRPERFEPAPAILNQPGAGVKDVSRETSRNPRRSVRGWMFHVEHYPGQPHGERRLRHNTRTRRPVTMASVAGRTPRFSGNSRVRDRPERPWPTAAVRGTSCRSQLDPSPVRHRACHTGHHPPGLLPIRQPGRRPGSGGQLLCVGVSCVLLPALHRSGNAAAPHEQGCDMPLRYRDRGRRATRVVSRPSSRGTTAVGPSCTSDPDWRRTPVAAGAAEARPSERAA